MGLRRSRALIFTTALVGASALGLGGTAGVTTARAAEVTAAAPAPPNVAAAPIEVANTALGTVSYREVGHGPALLLITGFSAGMDDWAPYFVNTLAEHFRVVIFDNAGIGQTAPLAAPLSVPEMAAQTSTLIRTLRLGRCDVLGWSMGGMIAQSLAVSHPSQVNRLVLAATQAGTGHAAPVSAADQEILDSGQGLSLLFPADQSAALVQYAVGIHTYPDYYTGSAAVLAEQQTAVDQWFAGDVASGRHPGEIRARTLVADGTEDALDPVSNDRMLTRLIHGARLALYPDAGHGFLFQDYQSFVAQLTSFFR
jgi:pimeloyl-ACP methyl ester carboxylesterase